MEFTQPTGQDPRLQRTPSESPQSRVRQGRRGVGAPNSSAGITQRPWRSYLEMVIHAGWRWTTTTGIDKVIPENEGATRLGSL